MITSSSAEDEKFMQRFMIHSSNPQARLVQKTVEILLDGGIIALPTDACYILACCLGNQEAADRLRTIRKLDLKHLLTLLCKDLSEISKYAKIEGSTNFRIIKKYTPGPYTFILNATKEVPKKLWNPARKTIGARIPLSTLISNLLERLGSPLLSASLILPDQKEPLQNADCIEHELNKKIDLVVENNIAQGVLGTTILDLTCPVCKIIRLGRGTVDSDLSNTS